MATSQLLRDKVSAALWQLREETLMDVCRCMKCDGLDSGEPRSKPRRALINMAESVMDQIEESEEDEQVCQYFTDLLALIEREKNRSLHTEKDKPPEEPAPKMGPEEKYFVPTKPLQTTTAPPLKGRPEPTHTLPEVTLRREFKIFGQIGESWQKEKLSYLSLVRHIESGAEKGHTETEIVEAVIRAVSPGLPLRDMFEIKRGLTLTSLLTILRGHYKVDNSTDLYHQLINISQEPRETPLNYSVQSS